MLSPKQALVHLLFFQLFNQVMDLLFETFQNVLRVVLKEVFNGGIKEVVIND
jgi:hypothetical protein